MDVVYTGLVTLVQLSAFTIGHKNPVSYDIGIYVIRNVLAAIKKLKENPEDSDTRGVIFYGATINKTDYDGCMDCAAWGRMRVSVLSLSLN